MKIALVFAVIYLLLLVAKTIANIKFTNKEIHSEDNYSIDPRFNDGEISLTQALKNFKQQQIN